VNNCATVISFLTKKNTFIIISVSGYQNEVNACDCAIRTLKKTHTFSFIRSTIKVMLVPVCD